MFWCSRSSRFHWFPHSNSNYLLPPYFPSCLSSYPCWKDLNDHHSCYSFFFLLLINVFLRIDRLPTMLMLVPVVHIKSSHLSNLLTPQSTYFLLAVTPNVYFQSLSGRCFNLHFSSLWNYFLFMEMKFLHAPFSYQCIPWWRVSILQECEIIINFHLVPVLTWMLCLHIVSMKTT
jgi:hypothetical protein